MPAPVHIVIRDHSKTGSPALESRIREEVGKLERFDARIQSCTVSVTEESAHGRMQPFDVHIVLHAAPGHEIVSTHKSGTDAYAAVGEAFEAVRRQLQRAVEEDRAFAKGGTRTGEG